MKKKVGIVATVFISGLAGLVVSLVVIDRGPKEPASTALDPVPSTTAPEVPPTSLDDERSAEPLADKALFVDPVNGKEGAAGTIDQPLRRPREAFEIVDPGTTVYFRGGTYDDRDLNNNILKRSGTPDAWIDIKPYPGEEAEISAGGEWGNGFEFQGAAYVRVSGFTIRGRPDGIHGSGVFAKDDSHHIEVIDNDIAGFGGAGISMVRSSRLLIEGNKVADSAARSYFQGSGINLFEATGPTAPQEEPSNIIRNNLVLRNYNGVNALDGQLTDGNCIIIDFFDEVGYTGATLIENNVCVENGGRGVYVFNSSNVVARNNTMVGNVRSEGLNGGKGEMVAADASNIVFSNNVVVNRPEVKGYIQTNAEDTVFRHNYILSGDVPPGPGNRQLPSDDSFATVVPGSDIDAFRPPLTSALVGSGEPSSQSAVDALGIERASPGAVGALEPGE